jgi:hypothetical protein
MTFQPKFLLFKYAYEANYPHAVELNGEYDLAGTKTKVEVILSPDEFIQIRQIVNTAWQRKYKDIKLAVLKDIEHGNSPESGTSDAVDTGRS